MPQPAFEVPPIGLTKKYPDLGTGPVATDIYWDPAFYAAELEAVFRRSWYMIGRVDQIREPGDFFTADLPTFNRSVLICRDRDGRVRGFSNVCTHRGNQVETRACGRARLFVCRFHGWGFGLDGELAKVRDEEGFFDLDKSTLGLKPVPTEVWEGFVFVSPEDAPSLSLEDYLGEQGRDLVGYPFDRCTQSYQFEVEVGCNWKIMVDSPSEVYHIPTLHPTSIAPTMMASGNPFGRLLDVELKGPHRTNSHWSVLAEVTNPVQRLAYANAAAQNVAQETDYALPKGLNATRSPNWTVDLVTFFPALSFVISAGMYTAHQVWPLGPNRCLYQQRVFVRKAANAAERFGQENSMVEYRDVVLEDLSTVERIQRALDAGQIRQFHFHDHELALRHQAKVVKDAVAAYRREIAAGGQA